MSASGASAAPSGDGRAASGGSFERLAHLDDLPPGELLAVTKADGTAVCLANVDGEVYALSNTCSHQDFPMSQGTVCPDGSIECAWHGGRFDCRTGRAVRVPAFDPLPVYDVRVEGGEIYVGGRKP